MTIEERAKQYATKIAGEYKDGSKGNLWESLYSRYIEIAAEQCELDIQRAVEWLKSNHAETLFIQGDSGEKIGDFIDLFIKAMKGE